MDEGYFMESQMAIQFGGDHFSHFDSDLSSLISAGKDGFILSELLSELGGGDSMKTTQLGNPPENWNGGGTQMKLRSEDHDFRRKRKSGEAKGIDSGKDYIHVRARRGQATDSHSLAERVRREKISERMKFLQNLVPGCNKVTGKASMLDEIINYVQSLQRQVQFLSMKLAAVNSTPAIGPDFLPDDDLRAIFPMGFSTG